MGTGLKELQVYQMAMSMGQQVWNLVIGWGAFHKNTIGGQLVRAADSVAANISEGFGRFHYKDTRRFYYYARGSLFETKTWLAKANQRNLVSTDQWEELESEIDNLGVKLNNFIKATGSNNQWHR